MAEWTEPKTNYTAGSQVTPAIFNGINENQKHLNETKITTEQVQNAVITSAESASRTNIAANENVKSAFGKIRKWFGDLRTLAFKSKVDNDDINSVDVNKVNGLHKVATSGNFNDLTNKPEVDLSGYITKNDLLNYVYPIGAIKLSINDVNPSTYMGGGWIAWGSGRVPVGVDATTSVFSRPDMTGGEREHTLSQSEMPTHTHTIMNDGTHQHQVLVYNSHYTEGSEVVGVISGKVGGGGASLLPSGNTQQSSGMHKHVPQHAGGSRSHHNLQPYITCHMWKRIA